MLYIPRSLKYCKKCFRYLPATSKYFPVTNGCSDGLRGDCKRCRHSYELQWHHDNPTKSKAIKDRWIKKNPEKVNAKGKRWYYRHRSKAIGYSRRWQMRHPDQVRETSNRNGANAYHRRRARKRSQVSDFTVTEWHYCLSYFGDCCAYCGRPRGLWHTMSQDHFIPVSKGGGYTASNIVPACCGEGGCNNRKHNKDAEQWLIERFGKRKAKVILKRIQEYFAHLAYS